MEDNKEGERKGGEVVVNVRVSIEENREIVPGYYRMRIASPRIARLAKPGQFVHIRCGDSYDPLLRRPFSIYRIIRHQETGPKWKGEGIEILYEVVGKGTKLLSQKKRGEELEVMGPLGCGFKMKRGLKRAILVGGGIGVAPLLALAEELAFRFSLLVSREPLAKIMVLIGARTKERVLCERDFKRLGAEVKISTDDGRYGFKGFVTDLLNNILTTEGWPGVEVFACGPKAMLPEVAKIVKERKIPCQVSLEERMGCGLGACLGCVVKVRLEGQNLEVGDLFTYKRVCKEGPVFKAEEVIWE